MREIGIDIETYSSNDLVNCGVYKYVEAPDFTILLFAYNVDGGPVQCVDFANGEQLPAEIREALTDPDVLKTAFNAAFERICISKYYGFDKPMDPRQWSCTMVLAARMGLPLSLGQCGEVLRLADGKMAEGKTLIRYFSVPGKNGRHLPSDAPDRWEVFKKYNIRDVEVEQAIRAKVARLQPADFDEDLYVADQEINDRGVMIDRVLVDAAARFDDEYKAELLKQAQDLTGMGVSGDFWGSQEGCQGPSRPSGRNRGLTSGLAAITLGSTSRLPEWSINPYFNKSDILTNSPSCLIS